MEYKEGCPHTTYKEHRPTETSCCHSVPPAVFSSDPVIGKSARKEELGGLHADSPGQDSNLGPQIRCYIGTLTTRRRRRLDTKSSFTFLLYSLAFVPPRPLEEAEVFAQAFNTSQARCFPRHTAPYLLFALRLGSPPNQHGNPARHQTQRGTFASQNTDVTLTAPQSTSNRQTPFFNLAFAKYNDTSPPTLKILQKKKNTIMFGARLIE